MLDFMQTYIDIYYVYECTNTLHIYIYIWSFSFEHYATHAGI